MTGEAKSLMSHMRVERHPILDVEDAHASTAVAAHLETAVTAWASLAARLAEPQLVSAVNTAGESIVSALTSGNKVIVAGNGGSAAIASHVAAEFLGKCVTDRAPLHAVNLAESLSSITAIGNDYGYDEVFARTLAGVARPGDVFVAMSTSGRSPNIVKALDLAKSLGVVRIALTGSKARDMAGRAEHVLCAPSDYTPRIQEVHMLWTHAWCEAVDLVCQAS